MSNNESLSAMDRLEDMRAALQSAVLTRHQRAEHDRMVKDRIDLDRTERSRQAQLSDCIEFAREHCLSGSPKYRREAISCLERAIQLVKVSL